MVDTVLVGTTCSRLITQGTHPSHTTSLEATLFDHPDDLPGGSSMINSSMLHQPIKLSCRGIHQFSLVYLMVIFDFQGIVREMLGTAGHWCLNRDPSRPRMATHGHAWPRDQVPDTFNRHVAPRRGSIIQASTFNRGTPWVTYRSHGYTYAYYV